MSQLRVEAAAVLLRELHQSTVRRVRLLITLPHSSAYKIRLKPTRLSPANTARRRRP